MFEILILKWRVLVQFRCAVLLQKTIQTKTRSWVYFKVIVIRYTNNLSEVHVTRDSMSAATGRISVQIAVK